MLRHVSAMTVKEGAKRRYAGESPTLPGRGWTFARWLAGLWLVAALGNVAAAQVETRTEDVATIDGIMNAFYEVVSGPAGEMADKARDSTLHHPEAWIAIARTADDGTPAVKVMELNGFYGSNAPRQQPFYEWETDRVVRRSGNMTHVWSSYASSREPGGEPFDTGVNSVTLFFDGTRWWIMNWMFDQSAD